LSNTLEYFDMLALCISMQVEDIIEHTNGMWLVLDFSMQEEDILKHTNAKGNFYII
jgi:hypothetical protein